MILFIKILTWGDVDLFLFDVHGQFVGSWRLCEIMVNNYVNTVSSQYLYRSSRDFMFRIRSEVWETVL